MRGAAVAAAAAVLAVAPALGACGSSSSSRPSTRATAHAAAPPRTTSTSTSSAVPIPPATGHRLPSTATPQDVIRAWADTLRHGQIDAAARFFTVPTTISNGSGPLLLQTRAAIRVFNDTLPCGAVLVGTEPGPHGFTIATFRLTERPGPGVCGSGVGQTARTAFKIRDGHIRYWLRVADGAQGDSQGTPA